MDYWQTRKLLNERWELTTKRVETEDKNINQIFAEVDNELDEIFN